MELITDFLIEEGYATDASSANAILSVMSEQWLYAILEENDIDPAEFATPAFRHPKRSAAYLKAFRELRTGGKVEKKPPKVYLGDKKPSEPSKKEKPKYEIR